MNQDQSTENAAAQTSPSEVNPVEINSVDINPAESSSTVISGIEIEQALEAISSVVRPTPLQFSPRLSEETGLRVFLKREDQQDVRSYKIRGALFAISNLSDEEKAAGIVTASAGNHAQGVAFACRTMGIKGKIYVPGPTPKQKRDRIAVHGGDAVEVIVVGNNFDDASAAAHADAQQSGRAFIEPFDARDTVIGQATVGAEITRQLAEQGEELDYCVVPVGGGGLISGVTSYLQHRVPNARIVGVEPAGAASLNAALEMGRPVQLPEIDPFVDGAAVGKVGAFPFAVLSDVLGRGSDLIKAIAVSEGAVCTELLALYQNEGIIAEPAGALAVAGLQEIEERNGQTVVCVISGGNNDVLRYAEIMERSLVHRGLKHYFLVNFPQEPGQLKHFVADVLGPDDDITLFEYLKRNNRETGTALVGIELGRAADLATLMDRMSKSRIETQRLEPGSPEYNYVVG